MLKHASAAARCHQVWVSLPPPVQRLATKFGQEPAEARFEQECIPLIALIPSIITFLALVWRLSEFLFGQKLKWAGSFAAEECVAQSEDTRNRRKRWGTMNSSISCLCIIGLVATTAKSFFSPWWPFGLVNILPWAISLAIIFWIPPTTCRTIMVVIFGGYSITSLPLALFTIHHSAYIWTYQLFECVVAFGITTLLLCMPFRDPESQDIDVVPTASSPTHTHRSPEDDLTPFQFMTVSWMTPLIALGSLRQLNQTDVWRLPFQFQHERLHLLFRELSGSVISRLLKANGYDLVVTTLLGIFETLANLSIPVLLQQLLRSIENYQNNARVSINYTALILIFRLAAAQSGVFSLWYCRRCYERSRGEMITMIYEKTLSRKAFISTNESSKLNREDDIDATPAAQNAMKSTLPRILQKALRLLRLGRRSKSNGAVRASNSEQAHRPASMGKILNLMRNDVYEVAQRFWEFPALITKPLGFFLAVFLIWNLLGLASLLGMLTVILAQLINAALVRGLLRWERIRRNATDKRLQLTSQFVEALRPLRWYDWQNHWMDRIMDARRRELHLRVISGAWNVAITFVTMLASSMFPVTAFYAYTKITKRELRVEVAFPALQLFDMLDNSLRELPGLITVLLNARIAMGRIEEFMNEPDKLEASQDMQLNDALPEFRSATFAWSGHDKNILKDITLQFPVGLTVIFGRVGSGKSALLQAILGELDHRGGEFVRASEMIGYCGQTPWLQSMNIRENITFCSPFDEHRYKRVLDACALIPDLASLRHGDLSNLGENGIGLSGGQRARVALARAVYSRSRILLLDDPLAALDHDTAEAIVERLLSGPLVHDRVVILVTHRVYLCSSLANQFIEVSDGCARIIPSAELENQMKLSQSQQEDEEENRLAATNEQELAASPEEFIEEEHRAHGSVLVAVYWRYIQAAGLRWWTTLIICFAILRLIRLGSYWFLKAWGEAYQRIRTFDIFDRFPNPSSNLQPWLTGFALFAMAQAIMFIFLELTLLIITYLAGKKLYGKVMRRVCGATFRFYDVTPVGRLMNRLTSDIGTLDGQISHRLLNVIWSGILWLSSILVIASVTPLFILFSCALTVWFVLTFNRFLPTSQSLRRLEMVSLTPLMSNFGSLLAGLTTIRAFRAQSRFQDRLIAVVDNFQGMDHFYWSLQAWLMYRFDIISAVSTFTLTLIALWEGLSPGLTAFVLTAAANFVAATHSLCKEYGQLQMDFVSVERVIEMLDLDQEFNRFVNPPAAWPRYGDDIVFEDVTVKYAPHLDPALSNISLRIPGKSRTAVIGRTGSGKSTLALTLLNTIHPESGRISIGEIDISMVDVHALRQRITFVAQDPVLFDGNIRDNLDPTGEYSDEECASVLRRVLGKEWKLEKAIGAGGCNLSQGQRQLIGLGRAMLRRSSVVILDEATASIDMETASSIQTILYEELKDCTIITIAHRIEAVKDATFCIVLESGRVAMFGTSSEVINRQALRRGFVSG